MEKSVYFYFNTKLMRFRFILEIILIKLLKVCGETTTEQAKCSAKCGGTVCDGKCGTNSSSCNGLVDSYWKVINSRKSFDDLYSKQELTFKGILTRVICCYFYCIFYKI